MVLQRVDERRGDSGACHAEGVADGDRAAVDVQAVDIAAFMLLFDFDQADQMIRQGVAVKRA